MIEYKYMLLLVFSLQWPLQCLRTWAMSLCYNHKQSKSAKTKRIFHLLLFETSAGKRVFGFFFFIGFLHYGAGLFWTMELMNRANHEMYRLMLSDYFARRCRASRTYLMFRLLNNISKRFLIAKRPRIPTSFRENLI